MGVVAPHSAFYTVWACIEDVDDGFIDGVHDRIQAITTQTWIRDGMIVDKIQVTNSFDDIHHNRRAIFIIYSNTLDSFPSVISYIFQGQHRQGP